MKLAKGAVLSVLAMSSWTARAHADEAAKQDTVVRALRDELARTVGKLALPGAAPPYHIAFRVTENDWFSVTASFGALLSRDGGRARTLTADVRAGDHTNDSGNFAAEGPWSGVDGSRGGIAFEDSYDAIRREAWLGVDGGYKAALQALGQKVAARATEESSPDRVDDFSREPVTPPVEARPVTPMDPVRWEALVKALSGVGRTAPNLQSVSASLMADTGRRVFVSSEATIAVEPHARVRLDVVYRAQSDDGMKLSHFLSVAACSAERFPADASLRSDAQRIANELEEIRRAPVAEDYTGPVLFEGLAAPQLIRDLLGTELSGTPPEGGPESRFRGTRESELVGKVGQRILPPGFRLVDDPLIDHIGQFPLAGCYRTDDEGIAAQKVTLVDDGIFKAFVMSRTPRKAFEHSNGHGRSSYQEAPRGWIGNLVLTPDRGLTERDLRKRLIAEARAAKKPYGVIVRLLDVPDVTRGRSMSDWIAERDGVTRRLLVVSKLTLDGKEERMRGAALGTVELRALREIVAAGDTPIAFNSASRIPQSFVAPALLLKEVDIKRPSKPTKKPPLMGRPL